MEKLRYFTVTQAASETGVFAATIRLWIRKGHLDAIFGGGGAAGRRTYLIPEDALNRSRAAVRARERKAARETLHHAQAAQETSS